MTPGEAAVLVDRCLLAISEHLDNVQILATWTDNDSDGDQITHCIEAGSGNIIARQGHAREWLMRMDESTLHRLRQRLKEEG